MKIEIITVPEKRCDLEVNSKVEAIVKDRNSAIAKRFGVEPFDVKVNLFYSTSALVSKVGSIHDKLGIFSGYVDYEDAINIAHPSVILPIFKDNLDKQISIMVDYTLIKFYMCKVFYLNPTDYKLFYKTFTEALAKITSGNFNKASVDFLIKNYSDQKNYKKDEEAMMMIFVLLEKSGIDFIYENLKTFIGDCNLKKSVMTIFKKDISELFKLYQKEMQLVDKQMKKV